jgi:hypothetical protein
MNLKMEDKIDFLSSGRWIGFSRIISLLLLSVLLKWTYILGKKTTFLFSFPFWLRVRKTWPKENVA